MLAVAELVLGLLDVRELVLLLVRELIWDWVSFEDTVSEETRAEEAASLVSELA